MLKFQQLNLQQLFTVTQLIMSLLFVFTLVRVEIGTPIALPVSALSAVPALLWLLLGGRGGQEGGEGAGAPVRESGGAFWLRGGAVRQEGGEGVRLCCAVSGLVGAVGGRGRRS